MWIQLDDWLVVLIGLKLAFAVSNFDDEILASEGSTVIIRCPENTTDVHGWEYSVFSETQIQMLNFRRIADGYMVDPTFRNSFRLHIKRDVKTENYDLQISNVTIDDDGVYRCSYVKENKSYQKCIHLRLKKAPKNIRFITNENLSVIEGTKGQNITLSCVVDSGIPRETLRINRNDSEVARGDHGSLNYTFLLQKSDHMSEFTCTAMSSMLTGPLITSIRINVNYRPDVVIQNGSVMNIHENKQLTLTCSYDCLPPMEKIVWFKINDTGTFTLDENKHTLVLSVINRNQTGIYVCQVLNEVGEGQANISVTVQYPPVVNVTIRNKTVGRRILICHAYGVPELYMYSKWEHMSSFGEHIRFLDGFDNGTLILPYLNEYDSYQDNGNYMCTVNNGIPDVKGSVNQTGETSINVKDRPRFSIENKDVQYGKYGESTKLEFYVYSFDVKGVFLTNLEGRQCKIHGLNKTVDKIMAMFYQKLIHVNGYRITFNTKILTDLDFRKYKIIVKNNYGKGVFNFTLQSASLPQLPYNITVNSSPHSITVYWSSGFNGGFEQSFYIEICQANGGDCREYGQFNDSPVKYQSAQIRNLQPGNVYLIRMYANNSVGYSNMTDEVIVRTRDLHMSYSKHIAVGVVAIAVLIICASVTVRIYRQLLKKRKDRTGNMNIVDVNEANQGVIPIENVLYQSHSLSQITDRRTCVTYRTTRGSSNTMDGPVVASYSVAESENDQEVFNDYLVEDIDRQENVSRDLQRQRRTPIKNNDLNYSEVVFSPSASSRFIIHGLENKTIYSEVDLSIRASTLQSADEGNNVDSDDDDDDFMYVEDIQKYIKREERNC